MGVNKEEEGESGYDGNATESVHRKLRVSTRGPSARRDMNIADCGTLGVRLRQCLDPGNRPQTERVTPAFPFAYS